MTMHPVPTPRIPIDPPVYFCPRAKGELVLDGNIDKPFWREVPYTESFCDISGKDYPSPRSCSSRVRWARILAQITRCSPAIC